MRRIFLWIVATGLLFTGTVKAKSSQQIWKTRLTGDDGILSFNRKSLGFWTSQQGVVFLSPERLAVYQVNRTEKPSGLEARSASGGDGNYHLMVEIFDAHTGVKIRHMQFLTTAEFSAVVPTHDGKFLVRAGNMLGLYSPNFEVLAARELPHGKEAPLDYWQMSVTPSGRQIAVVHQRRYIDLNKLDPEKVQRYGLPQNTKSEADLEILNADTLVTTHQASLAGYVPYFQAQESFVITTEPGKGYSSMELGTLDFEGHWTALHPAWDSPDSHCHFNYQPVTHNLLAAYGCGKLVLFSESGDEIVDQLQPLHEKFGSLANTGDFLAISFEKRPTNGLRLPRWEPEVIQVFDLKSQQRVVSAKVDALVVSYAVSPEGLLAVVEEDTLKVYQPGSTSLL